MAFEEKRMKKNNLYGEVTKKRMTMGKEEEEREVMVFDGKRMKKNSFYGEVIKKRMTMEKEEEEEHEVIVFDGKRMKKNSFYGEVIRKRMTIEKEEEEQVMVFDGKRMKKNSFYREVIKKRMTMGKEEEEEEHEVMVFDAKRMKKNSCYGEVINNVDAMHEIFSHLDADALAMASCVCKRWQQAAMDDSLWEVICTKHWPATAIPFARIRCVVNVMGGFRRLYAKCLHPLRTSVYYNDKAHLKEDNVLWSEDQVQLSLSLFSVEYYKKLGSFTNRSCHKLSAVLSVPSIL